MKYGYGKCRKCTRTIAATKTGLAYRHGHTKTNPTPCVGSGQHLNHWRRAPRWTKLLG